MAWPCTARAVEPLNALDRYLAGQGKNQPDCFDSVFSVEIDASLPALRKHGSMTGFKRITQPGHIVYRGLRFTGDNIIKSQVIARFLAHEAKPAERAADVAVTPSNYVFTFDRTSDYNGLIAYVFLVKPRRKRAGLFRGELWLNAETAAPFRLWGDVVKAPSMVVRSLRFVQDYQTLGECTEPLRLQVTTRALLAGTVELTVWSHPASGEPEAAGTEDRLIDSKQEINPDNEHSHQ